MNITLDDLIKKHDACVAALDMDKNCLNCLHDGKPEDAEPCSQCYNELLGMPVDPTNFTQKTTP